MAIKRGGLQQDRKEIRWAQTAGCVISVCMKWRNRKDLMKEKNEYKRDSTECMKWDNTSLVI